MPGAGADEEVQVVKIAAEGGSAVTKDKKGRLRVVHAGDKLPPYGKVVAISDGRIVLVNDQAETILIDVKDGTQCIRRVSKVNRKIQKKNLVGTVSGDMHATDRGKAGSVLKGKKKLK